MVAPLSVASAQSYYAYLMTLLKLVSGYISSAPTAQILLVWAKLTGRSQLRAPKSIPMPTFCLITSGELSELDSTLLGGGIGRVESLFPNFSIF